MLTHHLSLPKTSAEMATMEKLLHLQDSVPCKIRAKRGCATHPRSIAERVKTYSLYSISDNGRDPKKCTNDLVYVTGQKDENQRKDEEVARSCSKHGQSRLIL